MRRFGDVNPSERTQTFSSCTRAALLARHLHNKKTPRSNAINCKFALRTFGFARRKDGGRSLYCEKRAYEWLSSRSKFFRCASLRKSQAKNFFWRTFFVQINKMANKSERNTKIIKLRAYQSNNNRRNSPPSPPPAGSLSKHVLLVASTDDRSFERVQMLNALARAPAANTHKSAVHLTLCATKQKKMVKENKNSLQQSNRRAKKYPRSICDIRTRKARNSRAASNRLKCAYPLHAGARRRSSGF